jgi:hypothetical protein
MKAIIDFSTDTAAFEDDPEGEAIYILDQVRDAIVARLTVELSFADRGHAPTKLMDTNGNSIGEVRFGKEIVHWK